MSKERKEGPFEQVGEAVGGAVGKVAGRANDMAMNAVGNVIGSVMRQMGEWWSSSDAEEATRAFGESDDRACRQHYESRRREARATAPDYDRARPAYQFGYVAGRHPEYGSKPFDGVEAELERAWEAMGRAGHGSWPEVREQVSFAYGRSAPRGTARSSSQGS